MQWASITWCELNLLSGALPLPHEPWSTYIQVSFPAFCLGLSGNPPAPHSPLPWEEGQFPESRGPECHFSHRGSESP